MHVWMEAARRFKRAERYRGGSAIISTDLGEGTGALCDVTKGTVPTPWGQTGQGTEAGLYFSVVFTDSRVTFLASF